MVPMRDIRRYCNAIATAFRPQRIILFGSHATGTANASSDVDLLVITARAKPHSRRRRLSLEIRERFNPDFPVDIIVRDPAFVVARLKEGDTFLEEITGKGRVMYEGGDTRLG